MSQVYPLISISIDRGGTFTDVVATVEDRSGVHRMETCKLLSVDPEHYPDAPSEGIRRILARCAPNSHTPPGALIPTAHIKEIRMGTTVATNALLERRGVPSALVVSRGFRDILSIGDQSRPHIFALQIEKAKPLPTLVIEARERVRLLPPNSSGNEGSHDSEVLEPLDELDLEAKLRKAFNSGISSVAVCLMHSYTFSDHERKVGEIARSVGFTNVSLSTDLMPVMKYVPRATTASVDAYLTPLIAQYIANFQMHFERSLEGVPLMFVQSDGGLTSASSFFGFKAVLSGPAGGVVGCSRTAAKEFGPDVQVVGFDMGGTSTDVSRCRGYEVDHTMQANIAGTLILSPQVEVHTVAAGGGSVLKWENSMYVVGPESAGAFPGPACYGRGGPLTVTDANVMLGRIQPKYFPSIFGKSAKEPLDKAVVEQKFAELTDIVNASLSSGGRSLTPVEVAFSFVVVANEAMSRPIRNLTEAKGHRADEHVLSVFGGAGGQHACGVANALGIRRIFLHKLSSYLSAVGIQLSDVVEDRLQASKLVVEPSEKFTNSAKASLDFLQQEAVNALLQKHPSLVASQVAIELKLNLRFEGTNTALATPVLGTTGNLSPLELLASFERAYEQQFGFVLKNRRVVVDEFWARATTHFKGAERATSNKTFDTTVQQYTSLVATTQCSDEVDVYFESAGGWCPTKVYDGGRPFSTSQLVGPAKIPGPAMILGDGSTVIVEPSATAYVTAEGNVIIETNRIIENIGVERQPLALSVFAHRFMSIAEQMGYTLQRTSISTNIKERLDFSCAIFDPQGNLVANAPHIPVHLGAMGAAVRWQRDFYNDEWKEGDVMLSNHPRAGGSHLPDITVMTACFHDGKIVFYVASRGHHADVGGTTPGSMPPFSRSLLEEGAAIKTLRLVRNGVFNESELREVLMEPGEREGMSGCRLIEDCVSDLKAQVAANQRGVQLVRSLIADYGLDVVQAYMTHIQSAAEEASREVLKTIGEKYGSELSCEDLMDDGSAIRLRVSINATAGSAVLDFRESDPQVLGSTNCPTAVVHSAVIYCIRCLVGSDIPLNQGCLAPVTILVKDGSILAPDEHCAVVAGNVLTSQRVTDVIFMALKAVACSQGCMNNLTFGDQKRAYYETICGGSGAGHTFDGASCVQTHMTNTRITDPEILESRYPVLLAEFEVRRGSGGSGEHHGGDGCKRSIMFLEPMTTSISSERRVMEPKGLHGGGNGTRGLNMMHHFSRTEGEQVVVKNAWNEAADILWSNSSSSSKHSSGNVLAIVRKHPMNIGGKNTVLMLPGDLLRIFTPGGGGCGALPNV
ncbi:unnamed protein product [Bodo saltans]|uniref:5-oxoprolinase n=1 Tax=Bodo saltans TaxID=75058 RepID=A0A0S4KJR3_BODSA|nr:unnamed protein product [Bodo saltans]|eukprot:CUI14830.1 unnamed protein product [Bodo saltans]